MVPWIVLLLLKICNGKSYHRILSGGRDAVAQIMDRSLNSIMIVKVSTPDFGSISPEIRSLTLDSKKANLLLGTFGSEI